MAESKKKDNPNGIKTSSINLRILAAASAFASRDESRYYLNGVCLEIEERAVTYIATDGHRMVVFRHEKEADDDEKNLLLGNFIIPSSHCKTHKLEKDDDGGAKIFGNGRLTIAHSFVDVTFLPIDGVYPDWRRTVPREAASGKLGQFNLDYLASFKKFADKIDCGPPFVAHNGEEAPALVWFVGSPHAFGVVMPSKLIDQSPRVAPDWSRGAGDGPQSDIETLLETDSPPTGANVNTEDVSDPPFKLPADA